MSTSSRDRVRQALDLLKEGLAPFVDRVMAERYGAEWRSRAPQNAARVASGWGPVPASDDLDTQGYLRVMLDNWHAAFLDKVGAFGLTLLHDLREMRNRWAHEDDLTAQDALRAYDTVGRLLLAIGASELAAKAARLHHEVILELAGASPPVAGAQVDAVPRQRVAPVARVARAVGDTGFWVTTHYPHPVPDNLPWYVYLKSATTARRLAVGDKVLFRDTEYCMLTKPTKRLVTRILCTQDGRITEVPLGPGTGCVLGAATVVGPPMDRPSLYADHPQYEYGNSADWGWCVPCSPLRKCAKDRVVAYKTMLELLGENPRLPAYTWGLRPISEEGYLLLLAEMGLPDE